jgi:hypothetical protein
MRTKFITCIYNKNRNIGLDGHDSRKWRYYESLISLLKMTNADFTCYTSEDEIEELKIFFYDKKGISQEKLELKVYDLRNTKFKYLIDKYKNNKFPNRCFEIQYSKLHWWWNEDKTYDYYYWIDAGLSFTGLFPKKYMNGYYESVLFNNEFLKNLIEFTGEKFFIIEKENIKHRWSQSIPSKWYNTFDDSKHVIGGLFGGKKEVWEKVVKIFEEKVPVIINEDEKIYFEEQFLSWMNVDYKDIFVRKQFDTFYIKENSPIKYPDSYFDENISFYEIIEGFNKIK